ncbi:hypothetical protein QVA66_07235 [Staphylococcus chromogenes]|nr:hypothetical protein [Staphylococcus chromogenes]
MNIMHTAFSRRGTRLYNLEISQWFNSQNEKFAGQRIEAKLRFQLSDTGAHGDSSSISILPQKADGLPTFTLSRSNGFGEGSAFIATHADQSYLLCFGWMHYPEIKPLPHASNREQAIEGLSLLKNAVDLSRPDCAVAVFENGTSIRIPLKHFTLMERDEDLFWGLSGITLLPPPLSADQEIKNFEIR